MSGNPLDRTHASPSSEQSSRLEAEDDDDLSIIQAKTHVADSQPAPRILKLPEETDAGSCDDSQGGDLLTPYPSSGFQQKQKFDLPEKTLIGHPPLPLTKPLDDNEKKPKPTRNDVDSLDQNAVVSINGEHPRRSPKDNVHDVPNDAGDWPTTRNALVRPVPVPIPRNPREIVPNSDNAKVPTGSKEETQVKSTKTIYARTNYVEIIADQISKGTIRAKNINLETNPIIEHLESKCLKVEIYKDPDRGARDLKEPRSDSDSACAEVETSSQQQLDENQERRQETQQPSAGSFATQNASSPPAPSAHTNHAETQASGGPNTDSQQGPAAPVPVSERSSSVDDGQPSETSKRIQVTAQATQDSFELSSHSAPAGDTLSRQHVPVSLSLGYQSSSEKTSCCPTHAVSAQTATTSASPSESSGDPGAPELQANCSNVAPRRLQILLAGAEESGEAASESTCSSQRSSSRSELAAQERENERLRRKFSCPVCLDTRVDRILCPCMHGLCSTCYPRLTRLRCPICKGEIERVHGIRWDVGDSPTVNEFIAAYPGSSPVSEAPIPHTVDDQFMDQIPPALRTEDIGDSLASPRCFVVQACQMRGRGRIPVHPRMGTISDRYDSLLRSGYQPGPAWRLAVAGLFEVTRQVADPPSEDGVLQCFHCGSDVIYDESHDAPILHGQLYPNCRHVQSQRLRPLPGTQMPMRSHSWSDTSGN